MLVPRKLANTRQRQAILDVLRNTDIHPTAEEVYEMVRKRLPRISLGTVYRNLEALSDHGLIQKLEIAGTQKRFDGRMDKHYHIRCVVCGRVADLPYQQIDVGEERFREATDFEIIGHRLEFWGICPQCQKARAESGETAAGKKIF